MTAKARRDPDLDEQKARVAELVSVMSAPAPRHLPFKAQRMIKSQILGRKTRKRSA